MFKTALTTTRDMKQNFCWILDEDLVYENDQYIITVCKGFDFDFASIPRLFRGILPKDGMKYDRASCLHDALYASKVFNKETCDLLFKEAMKSDGVSDFWINTMYLAVKYGGRKAYNESEDLQKYRNLIKVEVKDA